MSSLWLNVFNTVKQSSKKEKIQLSILLVYPLLFVVSIFSFGFLINEIMPKVDLIDYRYYETLTSLVFLLLLSLLFIFPIAFFFTKSKLIKMVSIITFLISSGLGILLIFPTAISLERVMYMPCVLKRIPSPDKKIEAVLYKTYKVGNGFGDSSGPEYTIAVKAPQRKRKILYTISHSCKTLKNTQWKDSETLFIDGDEIKLNSKPVHHLGYIGNGYNGPPCD